MSRPSFHSLKVRDVHRETDDAVAVTLEVPPTLAADYRFHAGQYLTVRRPHDPEDARRSYSLCSAPSDGVWRIGVREIPTGKVSTFINRELRAGMTLECMPPDGQFGLSSAAVKGRHVLLIGAGSGITPLLSIARQTLAEDREARVTLLYGNRRVATMMFREELEDLKNLYLGRFALYCVFSREDQDIPLLYGRLDAARVREFLARLLPPEDIDDAYLCGPNAMLDGVSEALLEAHVPVHVERFGAIDLPATATEVATAPPHAIITVIVDGVSRELEVADGTASVLDVAKAAGLDLPFSCKSGVCATCRARVLEGEVRMTRNFALMKSDLDAGIVLSCQAHPVTPRVVISFDER